MRRALECQYMKKIVIVIALCMLCSAQPPVLVWNKNSCWIDAILQVVRNMRLLTEELLKNPVVPSDSKDKNIYDNYIQFLREASKKDNDENINKAVLKLQDSFRKKFTEGKCVFSDVEANILGFMQILDHQHSLVSVLYPSMDTAPMYAIGLAFFPAENIATRFFNEEIQAQGPYEYELIGIVVNRNQAHYVAYIKDQFDPQKRWYFCNDMGSVVREISALPKWQSNEEPGNPVVAVYQKIDRNVDKLANALQSIAKG